MQTTKAHWYKRLAVTIGVAATLGTQAQKGAVKVVLTDPANNILFQHQTTAPVFGKKETSPNIITVDDGPKFQKIDGFGWALTGGSAGHLQQMTQAARTALLKELFSPEASGIGGSYIRLSIGASDLDEKVFSYNDLPAGQTDTAMEQFDLGHDRIAVIPTVKEILAINPNITIMGSPWSPPVWMKTNNDARGGSLKPEYYPAYARYFVKYIKAMQAEGIRIDAITVQNEPLHPGNTPSLLMLAPDQALFVKNHLGPAFKNAGIKTKIIIYDHNADKPEYPISILDDPEAKKYIDGSAFHLYGGKIEALSKVHEAHPDKNLYFTEQWVGAPGNMKRDIAEHVRNLIIGASRNWSRIVIEWNLSSNPQLKPHTDRGGCDRCLGAVTISQDTVKRNPAYYIIAHAAKYVRPGSVRIDTNIPGALPNVAFKNPQGQIVLVVLNDSKESATFNVQYKKRSFPATLNAGAMATYVW
ncbi:glycoside hydrolase family 30 beta sandwich domain-containing protein [Paraflavitalea sp. CAU 1676]|uniref:glycoside hydrolase family 30 protein n=1 Tax=Paraflavitalea sp. CAU 1676 TaxID=3032598 RepID=UPI0023DC1CAE|nr:glycoside hydrolase family 30 beta sandwich domain-containing protein [Paraflavitalea sp. CAU 1676]MDF2187343.1 glycoside hydrolase family 30 beta sandwich domain-containing protein [Paraflavitalea sp. CAU 1676]